MTDLGPLHLEHFFIYEHPLLILIPSLFLAMDSSKIRPSPIPHCRTLLPPVTCHLSSKCPLLVMMSFMYSPLLCKNKRINCFRLGGEVEKALPYLKGLSPKGWRVLDVGVGLCGR